MNIIRHLLGIVLLTGAGLAQSAESPAPEISLALRGIDDEAVEQGEPLRLVVRLNAPRETATAISLAPASGSWSDAIAVEIASAGGRAAMVRAVPFGKSDSPMAKLDAEHVAGGLWRFGPDAMQQLAPGNYVVRARLVIRDGTGWTGEVVSDDVLLQIVAAANSTDRVLQRAVNRAQDALLDGHVEEAAKILDAVLTQTPDEEGVLTMRAEVALRAGNPMAAMICLNRAAPKTISGQPPIEREELKTRVMAALRGDATPSANPPAWSWPPPAVLTASPEQKAAAEKAAEAKAPSKVNPTTPTVAPPATPAVAPAAASTAKPADVAPITPTPTTPLAGPAKSPSAAAGVVVPAAELTDPKISADAAGQWAASATAGSQYDKRTYSASKATGAPDVSVAGNSPDAWCPAGKNNGTDWLEVTFAKPVHTTEVRIRQNDTAGAIAKVEAIEPDGTAHVWWEGVDPHVASATRDIVWFAVRVPKTDYLVAKVKITLNLAAVPGWKEIDAVQLVGTGP